MKQSKRVATYQKQNKTVKTSKGGNKLTPKQRKRVSQKGKGILKGIW